MSRYYTSTREKISSSPSKSGPKAGSAPAMPEKTASWPGLPGKSQPGGRNNGVPTTGHCGPFHVKKIGL